MTRRFEVDVANQWCRLYRETITDPKLSRLTAAQRHVWTVLMCLAIDGDGVAEIARDVGYTTDEIADLAGAATDETLDALNWFVTARMIRVKSSGTITLVNWDHRQFKSDTSAERTARYREKLQRHRDVTVTDQNRTDTDTDTEQNRKVRKRTPRAPFVAPTLDDIRTYCQQRSNHVDADAWLAHYEANGWLVGRNPMKDWRAAVRTWERNDIGKAKAAPKKLDPGSAEYWQNQPKGDGQ